MLALGVLTCNSTDLHSGIHLIHFSEVHMHHIFAQNRVFCILKDITVSVLLIPTSLFKAMQYVLKPLCWGREEDPGSPKDKHCQEDACSSALPSPHCPTRQHMWHECNPSASRVVWTVARAPCSEQGRRKLLAGYQLPAHCSCKWKS